MQKGKKEKAKPSSRFVVRTAYQGAEQVQRLADTQILLDELQSTEEAHREPMCPDQIGRALDVKPNSHREPNGQFQLKCFACQKLKRKNIMKKDYWVQICMSCFNQSQGRSPVTDLPHTFQQ